MAAVWGELNFDREPGATGFWQAQEPPNFPHSGLSSFKMRHDGPFVLGCQGSPGVEASGFAEPCAAGNLVVAATGRLDNREELAAALGLPPDQRRGCTDQQLVLQAFAVWGETCFPRLIGDWSLVLWDGGHRNLYLARDASGQQCLHYFLHHHTLIFALFSKTCWLFPRPPKNRTYPW